MGFREHFLAARECFMGAMAFSWVPGSPFWIHGSFSMVPRHCLGFREHFFALLSVFPRCYGLFPWCQGGFSVIKGVSWVPVKCFMVPGSVSWVPGRI